MQPAPGQIKTTGVTRGKKAAAETGVQGQGSQHADIVPGRPDLATHQQQHFIGGYRLTHQQVSNMQLGV